MVQPNAGIDKRIAAFALVYLVPENLVEIRVAGMFNGNAQISGRFVAVRTFYQVLVTRKAGIMRNYPILHGN